MMEGGMVGREGIRTKKVGLVLVQREDMPLSETGGKMEDR